MRGDELGGWLRSPSQAAAASSGGDWAAAVGEMGRASSSKRDNVSMASRPACDTFARACPRAGLNLHTRSGPSLAGPDRAAVARGRVRPQALTRLASPSSARPPRGPPLPSPVR
jgi:hypothetical protein